MDLPSAFNEQICELLGKEGFDKLKVSLSADSPVSIRLNPEKLHNDAYPQQERINLERVPWSEHGYYLDERFTFTFDPLFHSGCYYVQEASSMFIEQVIKQYITSSATVLDLCAAPGGKSTHLRSLLPDGSLLISNEVIRNRSHILAENIIKWGHPDVVVTNNDPSDFQSLENFFDVVVADVPCSGEGMFRKDKNAISEWSTDNVNICWQRQRRIISDVWGSLKPGGILIYSTCTYNTKENEENIKWIADEFDAEILPVDIPGKWNITNNLAGEEFHVYRFLPHLLKGEGFFLAVLRKPVDKTFYPSSNKHIKKKKQGSHKSPVIPKDLNNWLLHPDNYLLEVKDTHIRAVAKNHSEMLSLLDSLKIVHSGITIAEMRGKDIVPHHSIAMSNKINRGFFPQVEITYEQAIAYLRKETLILPPAIPKGYILLTYKNMPLGFVKNIGNRANNLYPGEWKIRSGYLPEKRQGLENVLSI